MPRPKGSFTQDIKAFAELTDERISEVYRETTREYAKEVIQGTPVDTGAAKGSWSVGIDGNPTTFRSRKDKTGNFTVTRANQAIAKAKPGGFIRLASNIPYMTRLEYGWSQQAPNGWVRRATAKYRRFVRAAIKKVKAEIKGNG